MTGAVLGEGADWCSALNMMEKQDSTDKHSTDSDTEQFPEKPDMHIFTLVDDDSDDELGEVQLVHADECSQARWMLTPSST